MRNGPTSRMPNGLTNAQPGSTLQNYIMPDPTSAQVYHNDFITFAAADLTTTLVGTGANAIVAADGGTVVATTSAGIADAVYNQVPTATFKLVAGRAAYFLFQGALSDVVNSVAYMGLIATSATPLTANDSLFIRKPTGSGALQLVSRIGGVETAVAFPATDVLVNATSFEIGIEVEPGGNVNAYFNPPAGYYPTNGIANRRSPAVTLVAPSLTQVLLAPSFGILNSTAAARSMTVDYMTAISERNV